MEERKKSIETARLLGQVGILLRNSLSKGFEEFGITAPQGMLIGILSKSGKTKISDISEKLGLSNSTVSGIVDRLEQRDIVTRIRSEEDRRVVYVSLSPKFEEIHRDFHKRGEAIIERLMEQGTEEDLEKITEGLIILKKLLSDQLK